MDCRNENHSWEWQGDEYYLQKDSDLDMSKCVWNGITQNEEDISYMFDDSGTPVKESCVDFTYQFVDCDMVTKTPQECKEFSSQAKRRRILDFNNVNEDITSSFLRSKERIDALDDVPPEVSDWEACLNGDLSTSGFEDLSQSEAWLADCLNDTDMNLSSDDGNASVTSDVPIGVTEVCDNAPGSTPNMVQQTVRSSRNIIFKGRKSFMRTPTKLASSVAYPFDFIKPSGVGGDVTLKDINQRILTPPPSKLKQVEEDPSICYPTSAFSGKPVVGKTKIPTQGEEQEEAIHHYDNFSSDDTDDENDDTNDSVSSSRRKLPTSYNPVAAPKTLPGSALPSALDAFSEVSGPPQFLNNCVEDQHLGKENDGLPHHRGRRRNRDKKDLPAGAVVEAKAQLVGIHERVRSDIEGTAASNQPQTASTTGSQPQPSMCLQCGIPKVYSGARGMFCPVCPADDSKKKGSTVKDKEKSKRMKGQSSHATWKSETEMQLRQHFD